MAAAMLAASPLLMCQLARADDAAGASSSPAEISLSAESVKLPGNERMGLVGANLLFEPADQWWIGPAVYGAASGHRGGLFVAGVEVQRRWPLASSVELTTGLYAGGGGGGAAPVGGGLMLRPAIGLQAGFDAWRAGLSVSQVRFPSGQIRSTQVGLTVGWAFDHRHASAAAAGEPAGSLAGGSGLGFDEFSATLGRMRLGDGTGRNVGLVGARAMHHVDGMPLAFGIETAAGASGGAAGYMEILGVASAQQPLGGGLALEGRLALGLGGGGAVPTGGGVIGRLEAGLHWDFARHWRVGADIGSTRASTGSLRAPTRSVWIARDLESRDGSGGEVVGYEWTATVLHLTTAQRKDGSTRSLDTVGGRLNRRLTDWAYLSVQAHSAFAGGAGAYSVGLAGLGVRTSSSGRWSPQGGWSAGAELLAGAAGGGGVETGGGAIAQGLAWFGLPVSTDSQVRIGAGYVRSLHSGGLRSPVAEVSFSHAFGLPGI